MVVTISCPVCGRSVALSVSALGLWRRPDGCDLIRFPCPACGKDASLCASEEDLPVLEQLKVPVTVVPAEALERPPGPPLSTDELIDLHFLLESEGWWDSLQAVIERQPGDPADH